MVGPSSQISKLLLSLLFLLIIFYIFMDVELYLRIQNYSLERDYNLSSKLTNGNAVAAGLVGLSSGLGAGAVAGTGVGVNAGFGAVAGSGSDNDGYGDIGNLLAAPATSKTIRATKLSILSTSSARAATLSLANANNGANGMNGLNEMNGANINANTNTNLNHNLNTISNSNRNLRPTQTLINTKKQHGNAVAGSITTYNGDIDRHYDRDTWISCDLNPLCHVTVKALLLDHTNHYIFAPLATIFDNVIGFSRSNFITANMISFFHVGVAVAAGKLVSSDSLGYRRLGVILFQVRTFLDDLDGHVARSKKNIKGEHSEVGTAGYYIDGICDGLGCIALLIGIFIYLKNNPPRRGYTQLPLNESKLPEPVAAPKTKLSVRKIGKTVIMFAGQLLLSSTAWNRYIAVYQDTLESNNVTPNQYLKQNIIFRSFWFFSVAWLWRIVNVHSLLHYVLLSIFCDKLWDFLKAIQYSGYVILVVVICFSEMHLLETHHFIFNSMIGST